MRDDSKVAIWMKAKNHLKTLAPDDLRDEVKNLLASIDSDGALHVEEPIYPPELQILVNYIRDNYGIVASEEKS